MENQNEYNAEEIFSKALRAGRRTYFFDVRETKAGDYYLTITESKKFTNEDGTFYYKKHKIYLYKEDFDEFKKSFEEVSDFIFEKKGREVISNQQSTSISNSSDPESNNEDEGAPDTNAESSDVKFEDM